MKVNSTDTLALSGQDEHQGALVVPQPLVADTQNLPTITNVCR